MGEKKRVDDTVENDVEKKLNGSQNGRRFLDTEQSVRRGAQGAALG